MKIFAIINGSSQDRISQRNNVAAYFNSNEINLDDVEVLELSGEPSQYSADAALELLVEECQGADLIVFPGNDSGSELAVRLAARTGGSSLTAVLETTLDNMTLTATKKVYAGNLLADYSMEKKPWCISVDRSLEMEENLENAKMRVL
ncbi:MAG: hypothetical protein KBS66_01945, partial [Eubacterium sp.]|nr:hypothetical protein [Candidatus Colimonas fimequi]